MKKMQICGVEFVEIENWECEESAWKKVYNSCGSRKTNTKGLGKKHEDAVKAWEYVREIGVKMGWIKGEGKVKYPCGLCVEDLEDWQFDCKRKDNVYNAWHSRKSRAKSVEEREMWAEELRRLDVEKKRRAYVKATEK